MVWGEVPCDGMEWGGEAGARLGPEFGEELCWVLVRVGFDGVGDDLAEMCADEGVDFLDADEVSGVGVWDALDGDGEFVEASQGGHGGFGGGGVVTEGRAVGVDGEADGPFEDVVGILMVCGHADDGFGLVGGLVVHLVE